MKTIVETYVQFDPGELQAFMDVKGIEFTAEQISDQSISFYPECVVASILDGTFVLSEHNAHELAIILDVSFEELFGRVFNKP